MNKIVKIDGQNYRVDPIHLQPFKVESGDVFYHPREKQFAVAVELGYKSGLFGMGGNIENNPCSYYSNFEDGVTAEQFLEYVNRRGYVYQGKSDLSIQFGYVIN